jgi:rod shape determining protein RodA
MRLRIDRLLPATLALLLLIALVNLHSATGHRPAAFDKQMIWVVLSFVGMAAAVYTPATVWERLAPLFWVVVVVLLVGVLFVGPRVNGARRWLLIGGIRLQPSEFAKLAVIFLLARTLPRMRKPDELWHLSDLVAPMNISRPLACIALLLVRGGDLGWAYWPAAVGCIVWLVFGVMALVQLGVSGRLVAPLDLVLIPMVLINIEPDLGTSLVVLVCGIGVFWGAGVALPPKRYLAALGPLLVGAAWTAWTFLLRPYQKARILGVLDPHADAQASGYHTIQSINAIANGGLFGQGIGAGVQAQTARLPEHHTDFIFAVLAEEWGLIGSLVALALLVAVVLLIVDGARHAQTPFLELTGYGVATLIAFQAVVNIGMVSGILPVVGMTLPFFSYGGSSLLTLTFGVGLMIHARSRRSGMREVGQ